MWKVLKVQQNPQEEVTWKTDCTFMGSYILQLPNKAVKMGSTDMCVQRTGDED